MAKSENLAVASLVCGILSLVLPYIGLILAILAIVFYYKLKKRDGIAKGGLITGIIGVIYNVILLLFVGVMIATLLNTPSSDFLPDKCTASQPFSCSSFLVGENVDFSLQNRLGNTLTVNEITLECDGQDLSVYPSNVGMYAGETVLFGISDIEPCVSRGKFMGKMTIYYQKEGETVQHKSSLSLTARKE